MEMDNKVIVSLQVVLLCLERDCRVLARRHSCYRLQTYYMLRLIVMNCKELFVLYVPSLMYSVCIRLYIPQCFCLMRMFHSLLIFSVLFLAMWETILILEEGGVVFF